MRICFYNLTAGYKHGGLETYCWEVARALVLRGHQVTVMGGVGGTTRDAGVTLETFAYRPREDFADLGTRYRKLRERLSFARHALPSLLAGHYDAVIVSKPYDFPALWWARRQGLKAQTLYAAGGTDYFALDRFFARAVDHWVSTSRFNGDQVAAHYRQPLTVIANGMDPQLFRPDAPAVGLRQRLKIGDAPLAVSTGRLIGLKGLHVIIAALAALPDAHFAILGEGPERARLERDAAEAGLAQRVHFLGAVPHGELPGYLVEADVFVQPTVGEEAFGISVVEGMACALPVLASAVGGLGEVVADGVNGRLLPAGDVASWRAALAELLADGELRRRWGAAGRQRALDNFTWAANAQRLEQMLQSGARNRAG